MPNHPNGGRRTRCSRGLRGLCAPQQLRGQLGRKAVDRPDPRERRARVHEPDHAHAAHDLAAAEDNHHLLQQSGARLAQPAAEHVYGSLAGAAYLGREGQVGHVLRRVEDGELERLARKVVHRAGHHGELGAQVALHAPRGEVEGQRQRAHHARHHQRALLPAEESQQHRREQRDPEDRDAECRGEPAEEALVGVEVGEAAA
mmetsp:Transcript_11295/g.28570  ORF Transcript_11295/g.28570 Transcript_11295/m.28570 type:complete len:202 (+) Transcript_11295:42-647(+)